MLKIVTLNLNGIRAAVKKGWLDWLSRQEADIVCVQELKAQAADLSPAEHHPDGYHGYFHFAEKKGYSGVGLYARQPPARVIEGIGNEEFDAEGRFLRCDWANLTVISLYVPSGSSSPERQAAKFRFMEVFFPQLAALMDEARETGREMLLCADWNIAPTEKDLKNWKSNQQNSGFLPEERAWIARVKEELGWVDVYRRLYPEAEGEGYTWWSNRGQAWAKNVGWRIDYQLATPSFAARAVSAAVYKAQRFSDHAPLVIEYDYKLCDNGSTTHRTHPRSPS
ncbi:MAG: exodeoxyribonuclease III [Rhodocyclaceae bacterium]|nr:exodeoxyribonuclease III [Rhodocyclaceae bacterium]